MAAEQINISVSPRMAHFIREKVRNGEYSDASEVVADAVRKMQANEDAQRSEILLASFEAGLSERERDGIKRAVSRGLKDIEEGRYETYDAEGLRGLAKELVAASVRNLAGRSKRK